MGAQDRASRPGGDTLDEDDDDERARTLSSEAIPIPSETGEEYRATAPSGVPSAAALGIQVPDDDARPSTDPTDHPSFDDASDPFGDLSTGAHLGGRYQLEKILGRGATGVVFQASHLVIGKRVALKCLYPHHRANPNAVERFFREARIAATVEHPNVIQVFDGGDEKDTLFLAMELLDGTSLGERLEEGPLAVDEALRIFLGIMSGVAAVHEAGVVHRDLKPDNVLLVKTRYAERVEPKVLDFGISKLKEPGMRELTTLGTVMGTPYYMAPEQIANTRDVDVRADVYSLGVMLYEALAGDVPYDGESVLEIFRAAQLASATRLDVVRGDVSTELAEVVARAMHSEREQRFPSVAAFADALTPLMRRADLDGPDAVIPDVRATVRDVVMSPLFERGDQAPTPSAGTAPPAYPREERRTVPLQRPHVIERERTPAWVLPALIGAGVLTLASVGVALLALFL